MADGMSGLHGPVSQGPWMWWLKSEASQASPKFDHVMTALAKDSKELG